MIGNPAVRFVCILLTIPLVGCISHASAQTETVAEANLDEACLEATLTGVGGPPPVAGRAQSGVFIRYGTRANNCDAVRLQFDAGRGTLMRLSQISAQRPPRFVTPQSLDALFLTHGHSDHTSSLPDIIATRWILSKNDGQFGPGRIPPGRYSALPVICADTTCETAEQATAMWDRYEIPDRVENDFRTTLPTPDIRRFSESDTPQIVWDSGDVRVSAVAVSHIPDSVGFLVETPAGSVCISGDTGPSENLVELCKSADILIHDTVHPVLTKVIADPPAGVSDSFMQIVESVYTSHTDANDLGVYDRPDLTLVMTHMTPAVGAAGFQGIGLPPYLMQTNPTRRPGPVRAQDFCHALREGGYAGSAHLGVDLMRMRLSKDGLEISAPNEAVTDCDALLTP